jgi:hypothetical protein
MRLCYGLTKNVLCDEALHRNGNGGLLDKVTALDVSE